MEQYNFHISPDKFVICQPMGGINDMLCQMGLCIEYAEKFNRKIIIDTKTFSDLSDHFSNYFQVIRPNTFIYLDLEDSDMQNLHDHPAFNSKINLRKTEDENMLYPLDFSKDSDEKFVLHRHFGGGFMSLYALRYFSLLPQFIAAIKQRKQFLGEYHAILIRHTDYQTDYQTALTNLRAMASHIPLYVFTDNYIVQDFAKTLGFHKLIINENLYKNDMKYVPIMHTSRINPSIPVMQVNSGVLSDLFLAALATHIYPTHILGHNGDRQFENKRVKSGFVNLAIELHHDRILLDRILHTI